MTSKKYIIYPDCYFNKAHLWVRKDGDLFTVGLTDYAQKELGDVSLVQLMEPGTSVKQAYFQGNDPISSPIMDVSIESSKTVADMYSPISGTVDSVNNNLLESPELVNKSPYDEGWVFKVEASAWDEDKVNLMDANEYKEYLVNDVQVPEEEVKIFTASCY
jgi:glycine cleavage system H protein